MAQPIPERCEVGIGSEGSVVEEHGQKRPFEARGIEKRAGLDPGRALEAFELLGEKPLDPRETEVRRDAQAFGEPHLQPPPQQAIGNHDRHRQERIAAARHSLRERGDEVLHPIRNNEPDHRTSRNVIPIQCIQQGTWTFAVALAMAHA